ncbi:MAG TPA: hypothetical protein VNV82_22200 [Bryobacteraceae bacterium]|jgi:hypothetical protein|nr:hypothetical protein [Bryobacteraceae bacterium]
MVRSSDGSRIPLAACSPADFNGGKQDVGNAGGGADGSEQLTHGLLTPLRCDDDAGVEDQSQEGGVRGCCRLLIPSST